MSQSQPSPQLIGEIKNWPIYALHEQRADFVTAIEKQTLAYFFENHELSELEDILEKTVYRERIRVKEDPWRVDPPDDQAYWRKISKQLAGISIERNEEERREFIEEIYENIISRYSEEIVGTFRKKTFVFARRFLTALFKWLLNAATGKYGVPFWGSRRQLYEKLIVHGPTDDIRKLTKDHILVVLPTHFSNLDSILVGYAMDAMLGLPSFFYGAGLNLYNFGPAAYFMNRLGAYRLDRRKRNPIYLEALKTMSRIAMERETNTLFFPGGTRSRSGALESKLKMGLLGTTVEAQQALYAQGSNKKIVVVPLIISYHFVLEAKFMIEQHLRKKGKSQYLKVRDQSFSIRKWLKFFWQFFSASSDITLSFGKPMDVLGNALDKDGISYDKYGNLIHLEEYFQSRGKVQSDPQRESEYTRLLADKIQARFHTENVVLSSHLVAFAAFQLLQAQNKNLDLFALIRLPKEDFQVSFANFCLLVEGYRSELIEMEKAGELLLSAKMRAPVEELVKEGIRKLGSYHGVKPLKIDKKSQDIISQSFRLLYYYHNRLTGFGLEEKLEVGDYVNTNMSFVSEN